MNWQKAIDKINVEKYSIPAGWDTREKIAEELQCSPDRVNELLKGGIASGAFETQEFPVWDVKRRLTIRVRCYRQKPATEAANEPSDKISDRIKASIQRNPAHTDNQIASNIRGANVSMVRNIRKTL